MANLVQQGENSDSCSTCGGNGELLCCDGCPRSFHFSCFDPPMDKSHPPEGEWYCVSCQIRYVPKARPTRGMFAVLKHDLRKRNPDSFELPPAIRDYYEGVKTGDGGEYEEVTIVKNK